MLFHTPAWDLTLFRTVNQRGHTAFLDWLMPVMSRKEVMWGVVLAGLLWLCRRAGPGRALLATLLFVVAVGCADLGCSLIKESVGRVRPLNAVPGARFHEDGQWQTRAADFVRTKKHGSSYISAHAANSMAAALVAAVLWPRLFPWIYLVPLVVGYSRIYLAKHYPSDVLMGWLLGLGLALVAARLWRMAFVAGGGHGQG